MQEGIAALSTPAGGAIAVIRASGTGCREAAAALLSRDVCARPRMLQHVTIQEGEALLDDAMAVFFPAPHSYTGEDMLELNCHGGPLVVQSVLGALHRAGLRPAEPGEFTKRAFLNGKLDLSQAEAVMDVINAQAKQSAQAALQQLTGRLRDEIYGVQELLTEALTAIDAAIDYPEEVEEDVFAALPEQLQQAEQMLQALIHQGHQGRTLREGFDVALCGLPNAGKSTLLNALLGRERAIVTPEAGTTRDLIQESWDLEGLPIRLTDTAGIRQSDSQAEDRGVQLAREAMDSAQLVLLLLDGSRPLTKEDEELLIHTRDRERILLRTKADLPAAWQTLSPALMREGEQPLAICAASGIGLSELQQRIVALAAPTSLQSVYVTNSRHIAALEEALYSVEDAMEQFEADCCATDIRAALLQIGAVTGAAVDEDVIDHIFATFCVGK